MLPYQSEETLHNARTTLRRLGDLRSSLGQRAGAGLFSEEVALDHDNRQGIVQLMHSAGQQGPHDSEFLVLQERFLLTLQLLFSTRETPYRLCHRRPPSPHLQQ